MAPGRIKFRISDFGSRIFSANLQSAIRNPKFRKNVRAVATAVACLLAGVGVARASDGAASFTQVARQVQPKVVKIYGRRRHSRS